MNGQDGRCTAAYESKAFPYFTINFPDRSTLDGNRGGVIAFFERAHFIRVNRMLLDLLGVVVTSDCELLCQHRIPCELLVAWLEMTYESKLEEVECPIKQKWDILSSDSSEGA